MALLIKGNYPEHRMFHQTIPEFIAEEAQHFGINRYTVKPLSFENVSKKIGDTPALLMLMMLSDAKCSKIGIETAIDVMSGIAGNELVSLGVLDFEPPFIRPLNFRLQTNGFLNDDFDNYNHMDCSFIFTPEARYHQSSMRDGASGAFSLDLEIEMFINVTIPKSDTTPKISEGVKVASVVVEFDGPTHLQDERVRNDKERDSMIQGLGKTVFHIQTPYKLKGPDSTRAYNAELDALVKRQIGDIKEHFRNTMYRQFEVSDLINTAINADRAIQPLPIQKVVVSV
jgi:hypothetical protein